MKNKKIKLCSIVCSLIFAVSCLTACGGSKYDNSATTIEIYAVDSGYGIEWLNQCIDNFKKANSGINIELWTEKGESGRALKLLSAGASSTTTDIIFTSEKLYEMQYRDKSIFADLTDIYEAKIPNEGDKTMKSKLRPELLKTFTVVEEDEDGSWNDHYYFTSWAAPVNAMVYNDTLLKQANLELPKTTDEWIEIMKIYRDANKNADGTVNKYSFVCSTQVSYLSYLKNTFCAQYDGYDSYINSGEAKDVNGNYTTDIFKTKGRLYNLIVMDEIENMESKYCDPRSIEYQYTEAQMQIVQGNALMIPCGDWFENEMSEMIRKSGKNYTFKMMRVPVISALSDKLSYWNLDGDYESAIANASNKETLKDYDEKLSQIIAYVDGETSEKPAFASENDIKIVKEAREVCTSLADCHCAVIPAWSTAIEPAKKFLQYLATDEANKIMMSTTNGGFFPYEYNWLGDSSLTLTEFQKSKIELWNRAKLLTTREVQIGRWLVGLKDYALNDHFFQRNADYHTPREVFESGFMTEQAYRESLQNAGLV